MATAAELREKYKVTPSTKVSATPKTPIAKSLFEKFVGVGESIAKKTYETVNNFLPAPTQTVPDFIKRTIQAVPGELSKQVGQPQLRAYAGIPSIVGKTLKPQGQFQQDLYGTDRPLTLERAGRETLAQNPDALSKSIIGKTIFPAVGFLAGAADLIPGGEGAKRSLTQAVKASDTALDEIARSTSKIAISAVLKAENPHITDEALEVFSPQLASAKNPEEVKKVINYINTKVKDVAVKAEKKTIVQKGTQTEESIPEHLRPLAEEAKKYKTADEFVASKEPIYHNTTAENAKLIEEKGLKIPVDAEGTTGAAFSRDANLTKQFGDTSVERYLKPDAKVLKLHKVPKEFQNDFDAPKYAIDNGYDALDFGDRGFMKEVRILDDDAVVSRKQLTDLHTRATKEGDESVIPDLRYEATDEPIIVSPKRTTIPVPEGVSPNVIKSLTQSHNPYDVLQVVKKEFPNLPDRVQDKFVDKFVRTKRIENVEGLVRNARNLDSRFGSSEIKTADNLLKTSGNPAEAKIPVKAGEVLDKTTNPVVRKAMRQDQKLAYIKNIKSKFDDPKEAVAAQHEYDRIWDDVNKNVVQEYEDLGMQKSFLEDTLASDNASTLYNKFYKGRAGEATDPTTTLRDLMDKGQKASRTRGPRGGRPQLSKRLQDARRLDTDIEALGYKDFDEAQAAVERYAKMRAEVQGMTEQIKELKPRAREAKILQEGLDEIAVIPRADVEAIDRLVTHRNLVDQFKDISGFSGQTRDIIRNFEKFFGKLYPQFKKAILDPFDAAKGDRIDERVKLGNELKENITSKFGITRGSKEDKAIQRYGDADLPEGERMTYDDLVEEFGKVKADNIVAADKWFQAENDRLLDEVNEVRKKIYPNNPSKLVARRSNYYRHYREMNDTFGDALREFFDTPSGIAPSLVGNSEFTKAKSRFLPFAETRTGQKTDISAIGGFLDYAELFSYAKHIDPQVPKLRYLQRKIAEVAPRAGEDLKLPDGSDFKHPGVENFLTFLDDFTRDLTGNTNPVDRYIMKVIPGGRKAIRAARFINNRIKANTIGGSLSSALAQIANVPAGVADTKLYAGKGAQRTLAGIFNVNEPMTKSTFLKERYAGSLKDDFPFKFSDSPMRATGDELRKRARWIMEKADEVGTKFIWNSEYEKALGLEKKGQNIGDPVKYADDRTRKLVAGRGIGEVPLAQKALTTQFIAPFTIEVGNAWWIMKDWVKQKDFAALTTFFIANYLLNEMAERTRGSRITIDPINSFIDGAKSLTDEYKEGNYGRGTLKFLGRQAGEVLANIPFGQTLAAGTPDSAIQGATQAVTGAPMSKNEIFGESTAGRYGTPLIIENLTDPKEWLTKILPPVGGRQIQKTLEGITSLIRGSAEDAKGDKSFDVTPTLPNILRALAFGTGATTEARQYYKEREDLFKLVDRQNADTFIRTNEAEKQWAKLKDIQNKNGKEAASAAYAVIREKDKTLAKQILDVSKDEKLGLNKTDRVIKILGVENGERAKYLADQFRAMKTKEEKSAYWRDLSSKKIITPDVAKQIVALLKQD